MKNYCSSCGGEDITLVDSPYPGDPHMYCIVCYPILFPPWGTNDYQPVSNHSEMECDMCGKPGARQRTEDHWMCAMCWTIWNG